MAEPEHMVTGVIRQDEIYTLPAFKKQLDVSDATLRAARRAGMRVRYRHGRAFIYGKDWIDYLLSFDDERQSESSHGTSSTEQSDGGRS